MSNKKIAIRILFVIRNDFYPKYFENNGKTQIKSLTFNILYIRNYQLSDQATFATILREVIPVSKCLILYESPCIWHIFINILINLKASIIGLLSLETCVSDKQVRHIKRWQKNAHTKTFCDGFNDLLTIEAFFYDKI